MIHGDIFDNSGARPRSVQDSFYYKLYCVMGEGVCAVFLHWISMLRLAFLKA